MHLRAADDLHRVTPTTYNRLSHRLEWALRAPDVGLALSEPTIRPTLEQHVTRLGYTLEGVLKGLIAYQGTLARAGMNLPREMLPQLRKLDGMLTLLHESVVDVERERRNLQALVEIGYLVNSSLDLATVLNEVIDTIIRLTGAERAFLMMRDEGGGMATVVARNWERESLHPEEVEISRTVVAQVIEAGEAVLTTNAQADPRFLAKDSVIAFNLRSILCVPLEVRGELTGVIYADNKIREAVFGEADRSLLMAFANQAAVALENARLYNDLTNAYDQTLDALIAALDARDRETEGHTRRVVLYALALGEAMGLSEEEKVDLQRGALMHDIGKIGVPDAILLKPGPLTDEEWELMRRHPEYGLRILKDINFFRRAAEVVLAHQERYDGSGYPSGLKGEQIPLGARVFAVADALDAITSDRPYRKAQPYAVAREEIQRCSGTQFDPAVVEAFLTIKEEVWDELRERSKRPERGPAVSYG